MFQTVSTNAAGILTIILMWSTLVWALTYMYMGTRLEQVRQELLGERWLRERAENELIYMDERYGHVIDDYNRHMEDV